MIAQSVEAVPCGSLSEEKTNIPSNHHKHSESINFNLSTYRYCAS